MAPSARAVFLAREKGTPLQQDGHTSFVVGMGLGGQGVVQTQEGPVKHHAAGAEGEHCRFALVMCEHDGAGMHQRTEIMNAKLLSATRSHVGKWN